MPNIKQFDTPALGLQPTEVGIEATAATARRGGAFYNQKAQALDTTGTRVASAVRDAGDAAVKYIEHREVSAGAAHFAQLQDSTTKAWNDTAKSADPNDPSVAENFRASMQPNLDSFKESFLTEGGRKWAESHTDAFREHMFHKTSADMSSLAGEAVAVNHRQVVNSLSNSVRGDPSSMDFSLKSLESSTRATVESSPNITAVQAGALNTKLLQEGKEAIIKSAALGHIEKTGEVPAWATDAKYSPYINGAELKQLAQAARYYERLNRTEERAAKQDADNQARTQFHGDMNKLELSLFNDDGELIASKAHIAQFRKIVEQNERGATLEPGRVTSMFRGLQSMVEKNNRIAASKDDPETAQDLTARLFDPDNPTTMLQVAVARNDGKLGPNTAKNLAGIVKAQDAALREPMFKYTMSGVRSALGTDPVGAGKFASFVQDFIPKYQAAKRAGTLPPDALDTKNPESFISKAMAPYQRSPMQIIQDRLSRGMLATPPAAGQGAGAFVPPTTWQWSPSRSQYRDPGTGKFYDISGREVK